MTKGGVWVHISQADTANLVCLTSTFEDLFKSVTWMERCGPLVEQKGDLPTELTQAYKPCSPLW